MNTGAELGTLSQRETDLVSVKKEDSTPEGVMMDRKSEDVVEALEYRTDSPDGSSRNLRVYEDGTVTLLGKEPMHEVYGKEDEDINYQTELSEIGQEDLANRLNQYHEESRYDELDSLVYRIEDEVFDVI